MNPNQESGNKLSVPLAIIGAGIIIALAVFFRGSSTRETATVTDVKNSVPVEEIVLKPISSSDYTTGNPNAPILVIEYSDTECPFCKRFHFDTFKGVSEKYGKDGKVAWAFRHFPLTSIHKTAVKEAEAIQCAGELGGNAKFWAYLGKIFELTKSNDGLDLAELPNIASSVGLDKTAFTKCIDSGKYEETVRLHFESGIEAGVNGTPATFIVLGQALDKATQEKVYADYAPYAEAGGDVITFSKDSKIIRISGAMPFALFGKTLDILLE